MDFIRRWGRTLKIINARGFAIPAKLDCFFFFFFVCFNAVFSGGPVHAHIPFYVDKMQGSICWE